MPFTPAQIFDTHFSAGAFLFQASFDRIVAAISAAPVLRLLPQG